MQRLKVTIPGTEFVHRDDIFCIRYWLFAGRSGWGAVAEVLGGLEVDMSSLMV